MHILNKLSLLACACSIASAADATSFSVAGTFKAATGASFTTLLGGGSFDGSFSITAAAFPASGTATLTAFSINVRDSGGTVIKTLTQGVGSASGYISSAYASIYGGTVVNIQDPASDYLQLVVPAGFSGSGAVLANGYSYAQIAPMNQATISAATVTQLPEASTWAMMMIGFGMTATTIRRRRVRQALS